MNYIDKLSAFDKKLLEADPTQLNSYVAKYGDAVLERLEQLKNPNDFNEAPPANQDTSKVAKAATAGLASAAAVGTGLAAAKHLRKKQQKDLVKAEVIDEDYAPSVEDLGLELRQEIALLKMLQRNLNLSDENEALEFLIVMRSLDFNKVRKYLQLRTLVKDVERDSQNFRVSDFGANLLR